MVKSKAKVKPKKGNFYKDYFLLGDMEESQLLTVEKVLRQDNIPSLKHIINESAELSNRKHIHTELLDPQTIPVAMHWVNKRVFVGDKPGLGKTVMSTASYAFYRKKKIENGEVPGKLLLVTDNNHVLGMVKEMREKFGVNLLALIDGTDKIARTLKKEDFNSGEYDGVATSWGSVKSNGFIYFYLDHMEQFDMAIFDETSKLNNTGSQIYQVVDDIVNNIGKGIDRVMFLNGSSFDKSIFDLYNQFLILSPRLFPSKKFVEDNYVIKGGKSWWETKLTMIDGKPEFVKNQRKTGEIVDYKNQEDLKKRIRHHYIARSKSDYSNHLPKYNYRLHCVDMNDNQKKLLDSVKVANASLLNSPTTSNPSAKFDEKSVPKLKEVLDFYEQVIEDRPIFYVYNIQAQKKLQQLLGERGYYSEILNGEVDSKEKQLLLEKFNDGKVDTLIFNIVRAINIPTSDRIIFYDIPTMPQITYQVKGRIDRNNYEVPKFYDFFIYLDSPEMGNIIKLAYFREKQASLFTGQEEDVYKQLIYQLTNHYDLEKLERIGEHLQSIEDDFGQVKLDDVDNDLQNLFK
jgi:hypothetical protein